MTLYNNKYRIEPARLNGFDYGSNAAYYITICTQNRMNYFGEIVETHHCASDFVEPHNCVANNKMHNSANDNKTHNCAVNNKSDNYGIDNKTHNGGIDNKTHNGASLQPTIIGNIAKDYWLQIPQHYPFVTLDEFVIMPNHLHGILLINKPVETDNYPSHNQTHNGADDNKTHNRASLQEWQPNKFGSQSQNIPAIIRGYKSSVKRFANINNIEFDWQPKYWDRIIRDEQELNAIRNYIINNPANWLNDENYRS